MRHSYTPKGICARNITVEIEDGVVTNVAFDGGCNGNTKGLAALAVGQPAESLREKLSGIVCGNRATSCPDQLAQAIEQAIRGKE